MDETDEHDCGSAPEMQRRSCPTREGGCVDVHLACCVATSQANLYLHKQSTQPSCQKY